MFEIKKKSILALIDAIIIILIIADIILLILITFYELDPTLVLYIIYFDLAVCIVLFCDFVYRIKNAENKKKYLRRNWPDIIAMLPLDFIAAGYAVPLRFIRIIRIIRVLRIFALFNKNIKLFFEFLKDSHLHYSLGILIFTTFSGTIIFYLLESPVNGGIHSLYDSFWYVMPTIATIGSEDIVPISPEGKLLSIFLMLTGLILFGMVTASIASWYVEMMEKKEREESDEKIVKLEATVSDLKSEIVELKELMKKNK